MTCCKVCSQPQRHKSRIFAMSVAVSRGQSAVWRGAEQGCSCLTAQVPRLGCSAAMAWHRCLAWGVQLQLPALADASQQPRLCTLQVREIYESVIEAEEPYGLPDEDCKKLCLRWARPHQVTANRQ